jgi:FtsP/CotA-like multicopper oxidase with cupredoxin domain
LSLIIPKISLARVSKNYFKLTAQLSKFKFNEKGNKTSNL